MQEQTIVEMEALTMWITGLHHAQITVPKGREEAAKAFYCGILGLQEISKPDSLAGRGGFWLQVGRQEVHVGTEDGVDRTLTKAHLAYETEDLAALRNVLERHEVDILDSVPIPGYDRFEIRDPFGNRVEFIQRLTETE
jgi:catechol 2,3-dioxygenase-like lactoylglutathione lyase family enzyme